VGDAVMDLRADGGAVIIARIEAVTRTDPAEAPQMVEQARLQIQQALQGSIDESFANGVMKKTPPRVNEGVLNRLYPATSSEDEDAAPAQ
jgi:hypothetical protein